MSNEVDAKLARRYKSMEFGQLGDEDVKNMILSYVKPDALTQEKAEEMIAGMYHLNEGDTAPNPMVYSVDGKEVSLYSILSNDKPNVINFEAHASNEWKLDSNDELGICYMQPKTLTARIKVANQFVNDFKVESALYVDSMDNVAMNAYASHPERLYVVKNNKIVYRGGIGPFQYSEDALFYWLRNYLD